MPVLAVTTTAPWFIVLRFVIMQLIVQQLIVIQLVGARVLVLRLPADLFAAAQRRAASWMAAAPKAAPGIAKAGSSSHGGTGSEAGQSESRAEPREEPHGPARRPRAAVAAGMATGISACRPGTSAGCTRLARPSNTVEQAPQRTRPLRIRNWSGTTLKAVPQCGQRVVKAMALRGSYAFRPCGRAGRPSRRARARPTWRSTAHRRRRLPRPAVPARPRAPVARRATRPASMGASTFSGFDRILATTTWNVPSFRPSGQHGVQLDAVDLGVEHGALHGLRIDVHRLGRPRAQLARGDGQDARAAAVVQ